MQGFFLYAEQRKIVVLYYGIIYVSYLSLFCGYFVVSNFLFNKLRTKIKPCVLSYLFFYI